MIFDLVVESLLATRVLLDYDPPFPKITNSFVHMPRTACDLAGRDLRDSVATDPKIIRACNAVRSSMSLCSQNALRSGIIGEAIEDVTTTGAYYQCSSIHVRGRRRLVTF